MVNYNAMIADLKHQFSQHFTAETQFTWSKCMDTSSGPYFEQPYPYNLSLNYGRCDYNVSKAFKLFGTWQPVFFHGSQQLAGKNCRRLVAERHFQYSLGIPVEPCCERGWRKPLLRNLWLYHAVSCCVSRRRGIQHKQRSVQNRLELSQRWRGILLSSGLHGLQHTALWEPRCLKLPVSLATHSTVPTIRDVDLTLIEKFWPAQAADTRRECQD